MNLEILDSGSQLGKYNMDFDFERTMQVSKGLANPLFRVYSWDPWCLSLGHNQKIDEIDEEAISLRGYDLVRRPTGGRAVFHSEEITYSLIMNLPEGVSIQDVYREIHLSFIKAFAKLGANLDFEKAQSDLASFYKSSDLSVACFASSARYELTYQNRKIVGSAQRLFDRTLLQHGSILIGNAHEILADLVKVKSPERRESIREYIKSQTATLNEASGKKLTYNDCRDSIFEEIKTFNLA
jgi:lipoate-protein ligase A